jgi:hypothetical protein
MYRAESTKVIVLRLTLSTLRLDARLGALWATLRMAALRPGSFHLGLLDQRPPAPCKAAMWRLFH